jgi:hypothetical protein
MSYLYYLLSWTTETRSRRPREEIVFIARPKIQSQSQIFRYGQSIFCLPHRPNFSDIFDLCLHWVSVVRAYCNGKCIYRQAQSCNFKKSKVLAQNNINLFSFIILNYRMWAILIRGLYFYYPHS